MKPGDMRKEITKQCLENGLLGCNFTYVKCVGFDEKFYNHIKENCDTYCFNLSGELVPDPDDNNSDVPATKKRRRSPTSAPNVSPQPVQQQQQRRSRKQQQQQDSAQDQKDREELVGKKVKVKWNDGKDYVGTIKEITRTSKPMDGRKIRYYDVYFEEDETTSEVKDGDFVFV